MTEFAARDAGDFDAAEDVGETTLLSDVLGQIQGKVLKPLMTEPIPGRPGFALRLNPNVDFRLVAGMVKKCFDKKTEQLDRARFAATLLITYCEAVLKDGKEVMDDDGKVVTLRSSVWMDHFGALDRVQAAKDFLGEVDMILIGDKFSAESGSGTAVDKAGEDDTEAEFDPLS